MNAVKHIFQHFLKKELRQTLEQCCPITLNQIKLLLRDYSLHISSVHCLKNVRNVAQFNIFDTLSGSLCALLLQLNQTELQTKHFSCLEREITLQTRLLINLATYKLGYDFVNAVKI